MLLGYELDVWVYSQAEEWWFFFTHSYPYWPWYPHSLGLILGGRAVEIFLHSFVTRLALRSTQSSFMPGNRGVEIFLQSSCPDWHGIHSIWDWSWAAEGWRFFFSLVHVQTGPGCTQTGFDLRQWTGSDFSSLIHVQADPGFDPGQQRGGDFTSLVCVQTGHGVHNLLSWG